MIQSLANEVKRQIIEIRLHNLSRQYFEAELDLIQAREQNDDLTYLNARLTGLEVAYNAIKDLLNTLE